MTFLVVAATVFLCNKFKKCCICSEIKNKIVSIVYFVAVKYIFVEKNNKLS